MNIAQLLTTLGAILLAGLAMEWLGRRLSVPRVTLLIAFGFVIGPGALDLFPGDVDAWFEHVTTLALTMVAFLVGERFSWQRLRELGALVLVLSLTNVLGAALVVALGTWLLGAPAPVALLLGGIAGASAPAETFDVVRESRAQGPFTDTLLGIVGIDDAWGLLVFSLALALAGGMLGSGVDLGALGQAGWEIGGALGLGVVLGLPAGLLSHRITPGEPTVVEAASIMLLSAGLALMLEVSYILTAMALGLVMVNVGREQNRAFHEIENMEWPFMTVFFVLAGASLDLQTVSQVGLLTAGYVVLRVLGLSLGAYGGGRAAGAPVAIRRWMGLALLPQAGVALGMVLMATQRYPELRDTLLPLVVASTVVFALAGPLLMRLALRRSGESEQR